jgi:hypothetical protein
MKRHPAAIILTVGGIIMAGAAALHRAPQPPQPSSRIECAYLRGSIERYVECISLPPSVTASREERPLGRLHTVSGCDVLKRATTVNARQVLYELKDSGSVSDDAYKELTDQCPGGLAFAARLVPLVVVVHSDD